MEQPKTLRAFISHASEDKDRFVLDFAKKLHEKGINTWVDKWEMHLGDSLVEKIFEEGIKNCDIFIIILSKFSAPKKWVKEELDSAVVKRIEDNTKLIPIILDDGIEIPQSIRHILRKRIHDLTNYETEFNEIVMSIYGVTEKPSVVKAPPFASDFSTVSDLSKSDSMILKLVGNIIFGKDDVGRLAEAVDAIQKGQNCGLTKDECVNSLEVLENSGYWKLTRNLKGIEQSHILMTAAGFVEYCEHFLENYSEYFNGTISSIANDGLQISQEIASKLNCKLVVVNSIFETLENYDYIRLTHSIGRRSCVIYHTTAMGKRYFEETLKNS